MIRELTLEDIAGLNQLYPLDWNADYEQFLTTYFKEDFFYAFVLVLGQKIIGTGNLFINDQTGWLANIIVDPTYRNQGLGYKITNHLVQFLKAKGCHTQLLIATNLGVPIYEKLGFRKVSEYICFESDRNTNQTPSKAIRKLKLTDLNLVYGLDQAANDEKRRFFINKYYNSGFGYFDEKNSLLGFYLPDFGKGLIIANSESAGKELLSFKHLKKGKKTLLPLENEAGIAHLQKLNLSSGTNLYRMVLGNDNHWNPRMIYSYGTGYRG